MKIDDWVICTKTTSNEFTAGKAYKLRYVAQESVGVYEDDRGMENGWRREYFEPWKPKVGERVRYEDGCVCGEGVIHSENVDDDQSAFDWLVTVDEKDREFAYYVNGTCRKFDTSSLSPLPVAAPLKIEVGKKYLTRGGSKAVIIRSHFDGSYDFVAEIEGVDGDRVYKAHGKHGSKYIANNPNYDLIAEWVDEPVTIANDNEPDANLHIRFTSDFIELDAAIAVRKKKLKKLIKLARKAGIDLREAA